jgi:beta-N-acetylhexosaminidase
MPMDHTAKVAGFPRLLLSAGLALGLLTAGCSRPAPLPPKEPGGVTQPQPTPKEERTVDWWLKQMSVEEKVGQLFWFGLSDNTLSSETEQLIKEGKAGGFVFFARQGNDPVQLRQLTDRMQALTFQHGRPYPGLVISVDHEGGLVQRWTAPFTTWPGNMAIGATRSEAYAEQVAAAMAQELTGIGITMNLSPDSDVNNNPANPVIGIRSFGEDPALVGKLVAAAIKGTQSQKISAVAKHFPGHGDTNTDSHKALPAVNHPWDRLDKVELVPFRSAIAADVDVIMSAHIIFPAVATDGLPATLSPKVLQGLLKDQMGYKGVVVTDAIDTMKAITDNWGLDKSLVMAINAGADALLVTESFGQQGALYNIVLKAVQDGTIPQARLEDAVRRQLTLKAKRGQLPAEGAKAAAPAEASAVLAAVNSEAHRQLALQVGSDALTLVRNKHLPLKLADEKLVLAIGPSYSAKATGTPDVFTALGAGLKAQHANVREVTMDRRPTAAQLESARQLAGQASAIVYSTYNPSDYPEQMAFIKELIAAGKPVIVVATGEPYDLTTLPEIQTYVAAYGYQTPNLQGVGALVFGKAPPKGKLPVSIPNLYPIGHGLSY